MIQRLLTIGGLLRRRERHRSKRAKVIRRALVGIGLLYILLLCFPQPLFAHHVAYKNFRVYSAAPIDVNIYPILDKVAGKLARSGIDDPSATHRVFLCDAARYRFFSPLSDGSFGVSNAIVGHAFLCPSDVPSDTITRRATSHRVRTLNGVIAHELTHQLLARRFGIIGDYLTPDWKKEGFCEYVAGEPTVSHEEGRKMLESGVNESGPARYYLYYAAMKYLMDTEHHRLDEIFASNFPVKSPLELRPVILRSPR